MTLDLYTKRCIDEELKPTNFPPLPTLNEIIKTALIIEPAKRSIADIVKSNPTKKKEEKKVEKTVEKTVEKKENKKEDKKEEKKPKEEFAAFPSLCNQNDEFKSNTFSYADMLKRKDRQ